MKRWRGGAMGMAVTTLVLLASGCVLSTKADRQRAEEVAEKVYPGELKVVRTRTLFPQTSGSEITFAVRDDPDAVVSLRVDADKDTCDAKPCEQALRTAREKADRTAHEWRALVKAFDGCGWPVLAVSTAGSSVSEPWIAQPLGNDNVDAVLKKAANCLQRFMDSLPGENKAQRNGLSVHIVAPGTERGLPQGGKNDPTLLRKSDSRLLAALSKRAYHNVGYRWRDGAIEPGSGVVWMTRPFEERQEFEKKVQSSVAGWLEDNGTEAHGVFALSVWRMLPGRIDRSRGYVVFCEGPAGKERCLGDQAVVATVDPDGRLVGTPTVLRDVREGRGALNLPPLEQFM